MYTEFHTTADALDDNFLKGIRAIFKNKPISIIVEEEMDETEYLLRSPANRKMLLESLENVKKGKLIKVDIKKYLRK
ncbi:MAG: hypothetical protein FVQ77_08365 [Cytophagales bacterium]|nr:hypothetical protein [Cytophagales bacterium]